MSRTLNSFWLALLLFCVGCSPSKEITNSIGMRFVPISKGTFTMGSATPVDGAVNTHELHEVTISQDYHLGVLEVTQGQYQKVMGVNPSLFQGPVAGNDAALNPVEQVSWENAVEFCQKLSNLPEEKKAGRVYRLPTEAEWEYACRAGSKGAYCFGDFEDSSHLLDDYGWFKENHLGQPSPGGKKKPNAWGLYDMHGNVTEWCCDWYANYPKGSVIDPSGPESGEKRVLRGGSFNDRAGLCTSCSRFSSPPSGSFFRIGFRVAMTSTGIPK